MPGTRQRWTTWSLEGGSTVPQRELSNLESHRVIGRRHQLDKFDLEDVVDIDLAIKSHLRFISTVSSCVLHGDGDESGGSIRTRSLENLQFFYLSKGQQERLEFRELREEQHGQVLNQESGSYRDGDNERLDPLWRGRSRRILRRVFLFDGGGRHGRWKRNAAIASVQETYDVRISNYQTTT